MCYTAVAACLFEMIEIPLFPHRSLKLFSCNYLMSSENVSCLFHSLNWWSTHLYRLSMWCIWYKIQSSFVFCLADLETDLECLKKWLDGIEDHLRSQMGSSWQFEELEGVLNEHKVGSWLQCVVNLDHWLLWWYPIMYVFDNVKIMSVTVS